MSENTNTRYVDRAGVYRCRVKAPSNGWYGEAGENKTPYIRIPCIVLDAGDQQGKEIVWQGWLTDAAFDRTVETLCKVFGWDGDMFALTDGQYTFDGLECEIVAESETYQGKPRIKVAWLNQLGGGGGKAMEGDKLKGLLDRLGRKSMAIAKRVRTEPGAKPAGARSERSAPAKGDDIPY
ncbi:MAG: hypothetical protein IAE97_00265 [Chthoniobacterales bacterium]|nr:hypothetical protein [Chthoniobacterales bacterium]